MGGADCARCATSNPTNRNNHFDFISIQDSSFGSDSLGILSKFQELAFLEGQFAKIIAPDEHLIQISSHMQLWKELSLKAPPSYQKISRSIIKIEPATLDEQQLFDHGHDSLQAVPFSSKGSSAQSPDSPLKKADDIHTLQTLLADGGKEEPAGKLGRLLKRWSRQSLKRSSPQKLIMTTGLVIKDESVSQSVDSHRGNSTLSGDVVQQQNHRSSPDPLITSSSLEVSRPIAIEGEAADIEDEDDGSVSISDESEYMQDDQDNFPIKDTERPMAPAAEPSSSKGGGNFPWQVSFSSPAAAALGKKRKSVATPQKSEKRTKQGDLM